MFTFASVNDVCLLDFDGSTIASGHFDNNLRFWDARSGNCVKEVQGIHLGQITSVCPSPEGTQILTTSRDNTLRIVDVRTYETLSVLHADGYKTGTNWSKACFRYGDKYTHTVQRDGTHQPLVLSFQFATVDKCGRANGIALSSFFPPPPLTIP